MPLEFDFLGFLDIAQRSKLDFLPVSSHQGLQLLGSGSATEVNQSIVNVENAFAFKQKSSSDDISWSVDVMTELATQLKQQAY